MTEKWERMKIFEWFVSCLFIAGVLVIIPVVIGIMLGLMMLGVGIVFPGFPLPACVQK